MSPFAQVISAIAAVLVWVVGWYFDTAREISSIWWRSDTFAHGLLVMPISGWLVWRNQDRLAGLSMRPALMMVVPILAAGFVWLLGELASVASVTHSALAFVLVFSLVGALGFRIARALAFPILFLLFGIPIGEFLLPVMMDYTAEFTVAAVRLSGVPVYQEGLHFVIPNGRWSVVEACSGVRYLIASLMVGTLYAYLSYRSFKRRLLFVIAAIIVPIIANWLRAYMIVMLGHLSNNTIAVGVDHLLYGWVFFGVVVMLMFYVGGRWSEPDAQRHADAGQTLTLPSSARPQAIVLTGLAAVAILAFPMLAMKVIDARLGQTGEPRLTLQALLSPGWRQAEAGAFDFKPIFVNPSAELNQRFVGQQGEVGVYLAYYRGQSPSRKLVSSVNVLVASSDHNRNHLSSGSREMQLGGRTLSWRTAIILDRGTGSSMQQIVVWRAYWVDGRWIASDVQAQLAGALSRLQGHGDDGAALVLYTRSNSPDPANKLLEAFIRDNLATIEATLRASRAAP